MQLWASLDQPDGMFCVLSRALRLVHHTKTQAVEAARRGCHSLLEMWLTMMSPQVKDQSATEPKDTHTLSVSFPNVSNRRAQTTATYPRMSSRYGHISTGFGQPTSATCPFRDCCQEMVVGTSIWEELREWLTGPPVSSTPFTGYSRTLAYKTRRQFGDKHHAAQNYLLYHNKQNLWHPPRCFEKNAVSGFRKGYSSMSTGNPPSLSTLIVTKIHFHTNNSSFINILRLITIVTLSPQTEWKQ